MNDLNKMMVNFFILTYVTIRMLDKYSVFLRALFFLLLDSHAIHCWCPGSLLHSKSDLQPQETFNKQWKNA